MGATKPVNLLGMTVSTAAAGATIVLKYFNGTSFVVIPAQVFDTPSYAATIDTYLTFPTPLDWVKGGPSGSGLDANLYFVQVTAGVAHAGNVSVNDMWAASFFTVWDLVLNGQPATISFDWGKPQQLDGGENIIPYFNVPSADNRVSYFFNETG